MENIFLRFSFYLSLILAPNLLLGQSQFTRFYPNYLFQKAIATSDSGFAAVLQSQNSNLLAKFDSLGNIEWAKEFQYNNQDIGLMNIVELSTKEFMLYATDGINNALIKIDSAGNLIFAKAGFGLIENFFQTPDTNFIISSFGWVLIKTDLNANVIWAKHPYPFPDSHPAYSSFALQTDSGNIIYAGGYYLGFMDNTFYWFIQKIDTGGNLIWAKCNTVPANEYIPSGVVEFQNDYYVRFLMDTGSFYYFQAIMKVSGSDGHFIWKKSFYGDEFPQNAEIVKSSIDGMLIFRWDYIRPYCSVVDSGGNILFSTRYDSSQNYMHSLELRNGKVCIYGSDMTGTIIGQSDSMLQLACFSSLMNAPPLMNMNDTLIDSGSLFSSTVFPADITAGFTITSATLPDFDYCTLVSVLNAKRPTEFKVFPTPSDNEFTLSFAADKRETVIIRIFNSMGVLTKEIESTPEANGEITISTKYFPQGFYFVEVTGNSYHASAKVCVAHD